MADAIVAQVVSHPTGFWSNSDVSWKYMESGPNYHAYAVAAWQGGSPPGTQWEQNVFGAAWGVTGCIPSVIGSCGRGS